MGEAFFAGTSTKQKKTPPEHSLQRGFPLLNNRVVA
jgi:hypothetical protein